MAARRVTQIQICEHLHEIFENVTSTSCVFIVIFSVSRVDVLLLPDHAYITHACLSIVELLTNARTIVASMYDISNVRAFSEEN